MISQVDRQIWNGVFLSQEHFLQLSSDELQQRTDIESRYWDRWFNGRAISEKLLQRAANRLNVSPGFLLDLIFYRRNRAIVKLSLHTGFAVADSTA